MEKSIFLLLLILSPLVILSCSSGSTSSEPATYRLMISASPSEGGTVTPEGGKYEQGQELDIIATPSDGWVFDGWTGDYEGTNPSATITMDGDKNIKATFSKTDGNEAQYGLTINIEGNGSVAKSPDLATYDEGTEVLVVASPDKGWRFDRWTGKLSGSEDTKTITMDTDKTVTAKFSEIERNDELFSLASNGITVRCPDAEVGDKGKVDGVIYTKRTTKQITPGNAETTCTSGITDLGGRLKDASNFNGDLSHWDVSSVTKMNHLFKGASSFNGDLSHWDVSNVENMAVMFKGAISFTGGGIGDWDVSSVTNFNSMFFGASAFNEDIGSWETGQVPQANKMGAMFFKAATFDQNLSGWCVENISEEPGGFAANAPLSDEHKPNWGNCP